MHRLACRHAKKGMSVTLTHPDPEYLICLANPVIGSKYECTGTITEVGMPSQFVKVRWANNHTNEYKDNELSTSVGVEKAGICRSIW